MVEVPMSELMELSTSGRSETENSGKPISKQLRWSYRVEFRMIIFYFYQMVNGSAI